METKNIRAPFVLAIDQGTSSTKTLIFDINGNVVARGSEPLQTSYLPNGFVEQDPVGIYQNVLASLEHCLADFAQKGYQQSSILSIGISNQRETFVLWDDKGQPLCPAIVWQCKRSVAICGDLQSRGLEPMMQERTGLLADPYFSATKLIWLNQHNKQVKEAIATGKAYFGTVDTWLLFQLTNGQSYFTDYTNASRTLFFNLKELAWDQTLLEAYGLSNIQLAILKPSASLFGTTTANGLLKHPIPINALIGDSHAAAFGEGCYEPGTAKATLGTGSSILMNIGANPTISKNGMVTTVCWSIEGRVDYAYEGVIVSCGATIEWLKNELGLFQDSKETAAMAKAVKDNAGVYLVPAFSGLGSPHWQMDRKASITGLSFATNKHHIVRAALESIPYQIKDVIVAMEKDAGILLKVLNADGGITANDFVVQMIADILNKPIALIGMPDVSALGAALLAGLKAGVFESLDALKQIQTDKKMIQPVDATAALQQYQEWQKVINVGI
jgi:glycerol kinase